MKHLKLTGSGLTSLCLLLLLTGCARGKALALLLPCALLAGCVSVPKPPAEYLADCSITYPPDRELTNGDVVVLAEEREFDTRRCNLDKRALRAWYEGYCEAVGWRCRLRKD